MALKIFVLLMFLGWAAAGPLYLLPTKHISGEVYAWVLVALCVLGAMVGLGG